MDRRQFLKWGATALAVGGLGLGFWAGKRGGKDGGIPLRLGYLPITDHLTLIAHGLRTFERLRLIPVKYGAWPELAEALRAGAVDAAFLLTPLGLTLRRQGAPVRAVLLGHRNGSVLTVSSRATFETVLDLREKNIAIPSRFSTHYLLLRRLLSDHGMEAGVIRYTDMAPPEMVQALATGRIDGFIVAEPFGAQAEMLGVGRVMLLSRDIWKDHICCVLNIRESFLETYPDAVQELVDGLVDTGRFIESRREEAAVLSLPYLGQNREVMDFVLNNPKDRVTYQDLFPSEDDFAKTFEDMRRFGVWDGAPLDLGRYLEPVFARKAYEKIADPQT
jgi:NitT/TauT family transport system substrate-binding protein